MRIAAAALILAAGLGGASASLAQETPIARGFADSAPPTAPPASVTTQPATTQQVAQAAPQISPQTAPVPRAGGDTTAAQIDDWLRADAPPATAPGGPSADQDQPALHAEFPRQIHGEVDVSVSNRGYAGYAAADIPLGQASGVDVAVGGAHERMPWGGTANQRSLAIGVYLDGSDVGRWLSRDKCGVQHAVRLRNDPVLQADGTCVKADGRDPAPDSGS